jgi:hypothetical protein
MEYISPGSVMSTLPVVEGIIGDQTIDTNYRSDQECFTFLKTLNSVDPCIKNV